MAGSLFYSVPTIDHDDDEDEHDDHDTDLQQYDPRRRSDTRPPQNESYMPDYMSDTDSDRDHSDSSTHSPPMSLFLDRTHQHIEDDEAPLVSSE